MKHVKRSRTPIVRHVWAYLVVPTARTARNALRSIPSHRKPLARRPICKLKRVSVSDLNDANPTQRRAVRCSERTNLVDHPWFSWRCCPDRCHRHHLLPL